MLTAPVGPFWAPNPGGRRSFGEPRGPAVQGGAAGGGASLRGAVLPLVESDVDPQFPRQRPLDKIILPLCQVLVSNQLSSEGVWFDSVLFL